MKFIPIIFIAILPTFVWADDLYTNDIIGGCGDAYYYTAVLEPISYNCNSGQFLPAGAISCLSCPDGYTCNGGTYTFNANQTQGISEGDILVTNAIGSCSTQFNQSFSAIFEPITYTCQPGYYLPAGNDWLTDTQGCTKCLNDNYCAGGTYTFSETQTQGITPCPSAHPFAPAGSAICYPHLLHLSNERPNDIIYLKSTKTTTPALNVDMNNDGIADVFANMTTTQTTMTSASEHYLKILVDGVEYYVCDDTSCPQ